MKLMALLVGMVALAALAGCVRETSPTGTTEIRSPSITDPASSFTGNDVETSSYIWADPP